MLVSLGNGNGLLMLAFVWTPGLVGLLIDLLNPRRIEFLQVTLYLIMGWVCMLEYDHLKAQIPALGLLWLMIGGAAIR